MEQEIKAGDKVVLKRLRAGANEVHALGFVTHVLDSNTLVVLVYACDRPGFINRDFYARPRDVVLATAIDELAALSYGIKL